jgi:hypothetical protein
MANRDDADRGNSEPKPPKPSGDDPRAGNEIRSLIHSDLPERKNGRNKPKD